MIVGCLIDQSYFVYSLLMGYVITTGMQIVNYLNGTYDKCVFKKDQKKKQHMLHTCQTVAAPLKTVSEFGKNSSYFYIMSTRNRYIYICPFNVCGVCLAHGCLYRRCKVVCLVANCRKYNRTLSILYTIYDLTHD